MKYELYADIWFLTNFTMDGIALVFAGKMMKQRIRIRQVLSGAFVGTCGSMALFFFLDNYIWYQLWVHFLINPFMVYLCFRSREKKEFLGQWALTYLAVFLMGGILGWGMRISQGGKYYVFCLAGALFILLSVEKLLDYFRRRKETVYDLLLVTKEEKIPVKGFYDTGNLLMDPLINRPVHIIKKEVLEEQILKEEIPVRLIPFHSLGKETGWLKTVTIEGMYVMKEEKPLYLAKPVFGMAEEALFQDGRCDVILNGRF